MLVGVATPLCARQDAFSVSSQCPGDGFPGKQASRQGWFI